MAAVLDVDEVLEVLHRMDMLSDFTPEQMRWVADHGVVVDIPAGETVLSVGDADAGAASHEVCAESISEASSAGMRECAGRNQARCRPPARPH